MSDTTDRETAAREVYALAEGIEQGYYGNTEMVQINLPDGQVIRQVRVTVRSAGLTAAQALAVIDEPSIPLDRMAKVQSLPEPKPGGITRRAAHIKRAAFGDES